MRNFWLPNLKLDVAKGVDTMGEAVKIVVVDDVFCETFIFRYVGSVDFIVVVRLPFAEE